MLSIKSIEGKLPVGDLGNFSASKACGKAKKEKPTKLKLSLKLTPNGCLWGGVRGIMGGSGGLLGRLGGGFGRPKVILDASWERLGGVRGRCGGI